MIYWNEKLTFFIFSAPNQARRTSFPKIQKKMMTMTTMMMKWIKKMNELDRTIEIFEPIEKPHKQSPIINF